MLLMLAAVVITAAQLIAGAGTLHSSAVSTIAPPVYVAALNENLEQQGHDEVLFVHADDQQAAYDQMRRGVTSATLAVDLRGTHDGLYLDSTREQRFNRVTAATVSDLLAAQGRIVSETTVVIPESQVRAPIRLSQILSTAALIAGLLVATLTTFVLGPRAWTAGSIPIRLAGLAAVSAVLPILLALMSPTSLPLSALAALWLGCMMSACIALALESVAGLLGMGLYFAACLVFIVPAATLPDIQMIPEATRYLWVWTPFGAEQLLLRASLTFGDAEALRPLLVCLAWLIGAVLTMHLTRTLEPMDATPAYRYWRWEIGIIVAIFTGALITGSALVPSAAVDPAPQPKIATNTLSRCVRLPVPRTVGDLNRIADAQGFEEFQGGDVGIDVLLQDGRRAWFFADTLKGQKGALSIARNSVLIRDGECVRAVVTPYGEAVIPSRKAVAQTRAAGYWPMSVVKVSQPGYDLLYVTAQRVQRTGSGQFDFGGLGPAVAVLLVPTGGVPQLVTVQDIGRDRPDMSYPMWGAATAVDDGWLYIYGTATPGSPGVYGFSLRVARVPVEQILDPAAWEYWNGYVWSPDAHEAAELIPAVGGTSQTLSVFAKNGVWYALSKRNEFMGTELTVWTAPAPNGPFDAGPVLALLPSDPLTGTLVYMPLAHPDLFPRPHSMVVSYSQNDAEVQDVFDDPRKYRPRFLRVRLP